MIYTFTGKKFLINPTIKKPGYAYILSTPNPESKTYTDSAFGFTFEIEEQLKFNYPMQPKKVFMIKSCEYFDSDDYEKFCKKNQFKYFDKDFGTDYSKYETLKIEKGGRDIRCFQNNLWYKN
jgi:hypothetical protein